MATTSLVVELLIVGFFMVVWLVLWSVRLSLIDLEFLKQLSAFAQSLPGLMFITALSYQLGVAMNGISYTITKRFGPTHYRSQIDPGVSFEAIKTKLLLEASQELNQVLTLRLSVVRLTRTGIVNFGLISAAMFSFGGKIAMAGIVPLFIAAICAVGWRRAYRLYYGKVAYAYHELTKRPLNEAVYGK
ncbi:MAG TPA: hypothetical protein VGO68_05270 [Pyrinomonadaceae bacterium]|jgi:hypothetical protein|nr:hypothetical protein [Pyrinomonadaceae bacterium]